MDGITGTEVFILVLILGIIFVGIFFFVRAESMETSVPGPQQESLAITVLRDLAAGKSVSQNDFESAFSGDGSTERDTAIRSVAFDLGITYQEIRRMISGMNFSIVYTGPLDKIPAKLRPVTVQPAEAPEVIQVQGPGILPE